MNGRLPPIQILGMGKECLFRGPAQRLVERDGIGDDVVVVGHFAKLGTQQAAACSQYLQVVGVVVLHQFLCGIYGLAQAAHLIGQHFLLGLSVVDGCHGGVHLFSGIQ